MGAESFERELISNEEIADLNIAEHINIAITGHVDHGKSTILGRLLVDTDSLPIGKLEQVKETCQRNSKPFEYAFLLDSLKDEQSQGITIDSCRIFFKTAKRKYIIIDNPGHIEFLKNMVTGASRAEAALLVIDAAEGIKENTRRHSYLLSMLGIKQMAVLINKMDLVDYSQDVFNAIVQELCEFLEKFEQKPTIFIPVSGLNGDNIVKRSPHLSWYKGKTVLELLDDFVIDKLPEDKPFRMPVQDIYKFTKHGDNRRIIAGMVESGTITVGDRVIFYPSGKSSVVKSVEGFNAAPLTTVGPGWALGFTTEEQIYVKRGECAGLANEQHPIVGTRILAHVFWLGKAPLKKEKSYLLKIGTKKVKMSLAEIRFNMDASNLDHNTKDQVDRNEVAEVVLELNQPIAFDLPHEITQTSRFVIVDDFEITGGGIIVNAIANQVPLIEDQINRRIAQWERSSIDIQQRFEKYGQKSVMLLMIGDDFNKKNIAKMVERQLFADGKFVYYIGIDTDGNKFETDTNISSISNAETRIQQLAEIASLLLDAGLILIATASGLTPEHLEILKIALSPEKIRTIWVGSERDTDIDVDIQFTSNDDIDEFVQKIEQLVITV